MMDVRANLLPLKQQQKTYNCKAVYIHKFSSVMHIFDRATLLGEEAN